MADPRFSPVQNNPTRQGPPKKDGFPILPVVLLAIYGIYAGLMLIAPIYVDPLNEAINGALDITARLAIGGVLLVLFIIIMIYNMSEGSSGPQRKAPPGPPLRKPPMAPGQVQAKQFKPVVQPKPAQAVPAAPPVKKEEAPAKAVSEIKKPLIILYPKEVEGGIYGDTFIHLTDSKTLRIRSMVVEPEYLS